MKRTELLELAKEVDFAGRRMIAFRFEEEGYACQKASDLLRQIAESTPVATVYVAAAGEKPMITGWDAAGFTAGEESAIYTLPLED